jgi:hypothetical protein
MMDREATNTLAVMIMGILSRIDSDISEAQYASGGMSYSLVMETTDGFVRILFGGINIWDSDDLPEDFSAEDIEKEIWKELDLMAETIASLRPVIAKKIPPSERTAPEPDPVVDILNRLLEWEKNQGGFEAPVWRDAERLRDSMQAAEEEA